MELTVTAHAVLRFAERVLSTDIAAARRACAAETGMEPIDAAVLSWMQECGRIDSAEVRLEFLARIACGRRSSRKSEGGCMIGLYTLTDCDCRTVVEAVTGNVVTVSLAKIPVRAGVAYGGYSKWAA